jgi:hypothetical protein
MFNFHARNQLHPIREQLKDMERQYKGGNEFNLAGNTIYKNNHPMLFGAKDKVSLFLFICIC